MKKIISLLLSVAMMLLLSVSIFATPITSISVEFDPILNENIPADHADINICVDSSTNTTSKLRFKLTGADIIKKFEGTSFFFANDLTNFSFENTTFLDHTNYKSQEYLFVFYCELPEDTTIGKNTAITATSGYPGKYLFTENNIAYFYIKFTPHNSEELKELNSSKNIDVTVTYDDSVTKPPVYSVVITWGSMDFTYQPASKGTWNPTTHEYSDATSESWSCAENANAITVTNHSNAEIKASFSYQAEDDYEEISGTFYNSVSQQFDNPQSIASADVKLDTQEAPSFTAFLKLSGTLNDKDANQATCGSVTVTISE